MPLYLEIPKEILRGLVTWGQGFTLKYYSKNKEGRKNEVSICCLLYTSDAADETSTV